MLGTGNRQKLSTEYFTLNVTVPKTTHDVQCFPGRKINPTHVGSFLCRFLTFHSPAQACRRFQGVRSGRWRTCRSCGTQGPRRLGTASPSPCAHCEPGEFSLSRQAAVAQTPTLAATHLGCSTPRRTGRRLHLCKEETT